MEEDLKKNAETITKIQEILIPEMLSEIDIKINKQRKIIENTLITGRGSSVLESATREAIDSFKQILDSNSRSVKKVIETEVNHLFLGISKEFKKMTAFIIQAKSSMNELPSPLNNQLHILLQNLPNSYSQSIEQALMPVMKEFQSINEHLGKAISSTTDSLTLLTTVQSFINQPQEKTDSLQEELRKGINASIMPLRNVMRKITAFTIRAQRDQGEVPSPYIYYFPYPKGPPAASAEGHLIKIEKPLEEVTENETINGTPPLKKPFRKDLFDEETEDVD